MPATILRHQSKKEKYWQSLGLIDFSQGLLKLEQILQHLQQPTLTQQGYSQLSPLSVGGLSGLGSLGSANGGALTALGSSISSTDLQLALALSSNPAANQQQFVSLATLAALGNHSSLSPAGMFIPLFYYFLLCWLINSVRVRALSTTVMSCNASFIYEICFFAIQRSTALIPVLQIFV